MILFSQVNRIRNACSHAVIINALALAIPRHRNNYWRRW